ncbi:MAG: Gfo/Idh/MocA family oxidoreductase [Bacteroidota bacterium]
MTTPTSSRRTFLGNTLVAASGLMLDPHAFSLLSSSSPNRSIQVAIMGVKSRGHALAKVFAAQKDCEVSWICEVDDRYVQRVLTDIAPYQKRTPKVEKDVRKVLEDPSLDALVIAAPDHWHAPAAIMACQAGKHVYVEKPCSHNPQEGEWLVEASRKYNRVVQMGNQRRSWANVQQAIEEIHSGIIGRVYFAKGWYANTRQSIGFGKKTAVPPQLNFDLWQGPAPRQAYRDNVHPYNWHWFWHWGTGEALNNGTHFLDLMRWGLQVEYPSRVLSSGGRYHFSDDWETPDTQMINLDFEAGKSMLWESRSCNGSHVHGSSAGVMFYGEGGSVLIPSGNAYTVFDNSRQAKVIKSVSESDKTDQPDQQNTVGPGSRYDAPHVLDFLNAIRNGSVPRSEIQGGHKSVLLCQLGNIAYRTGRSLNIDQRNGHIIGDPEAMKLWSRTYEPGWEIHV